MKKILLSVLMCVSVCCNNVLAAVNIENDNCKYTVTADCASGEKVTMIVGRGGSELNDFDIIAVREGKGDANEITFEFEIEDGIEYEGKYTAYVRNDFSGSKTEVNFMHVLDSSVALATAALMNVSSANGEDGLEGLLKTDSVHKKALDKMNIKTDIYDTLSDEKKQAIRDLFIAEKETSDNLIQLINNSIAVIMINSEENLDAALSCATSDFKEFAYEKASDDLKKWIKNLIEGEYATTEKFVSRYDECCILFKFNNAKFSEFTKLFDDYADALNITDENTYKKYDSLSKTNKTKAGEELVVLLDKTPAKTPKDLIEATSKAYSAAIKSADGNNSSGGLTDGGSSSGGGIIYPGGTNVTATQPGAQNKPGIKYDDLQNVTWAEAAVNALSERGIVSGDGNGNFRPNDTITREEFAKMLITAIGSVNENASSSFSDLDKNAWYYKYVAGAYNAGIVSGISDTEFGIGKEITRQEMAVMLSRALKIYKQIPNIRDGIEFSDNDKIAEWAKEAVISMYCTGIMSGVDDGKFAPDGVATRAQAAVVVYNLIK